jgi:hypothetical protein
LHSGYGRVGGHNATRLMLQYINGVSSHRIEGEQKQKHNTKTSLCATTSNVNETCRYAKL